MAAAWPPHLGVYMIVSVAAYAHASVQYQITYITQVLSGLFWIMDYVLMFTNFGWVAAVHGDFFIKQVIAPAGTPNPSLHKFFPLVNIYPKVETCFCLHFQFECIWILNIEPG